MYHNIYHAGCRLSILQSTQLGIDTHIVACRCLLAIQLFIRLSQHSLIQTDIHVANSSAALRDMPLIQTACVIREHAFDPAIFCMHPGSLALLLPHLTYSANPTPSLDIRRVSSALLHNGSQLPIHIHIHQCGFIAIRDRFLTGAPYVQYTPHTTEVLPNALQNLI